MWEVRRVTDGNIFSIVVNNESEANGVYWGIVYKETILKDKKLKGEKLKEAISALRKEMFMSEISSSSNNVVMAMEKYEKWASQL